MPVINAPAVAPVLIPGSPNLPNPAYKSAKVVSVGAGNLDLYTVPANRRALAFYVATNTTAAAVTLRATVKISGTYYNTGGGVSIAANATADGYEYEPQMGVLEAGETLACNASVAGVNFWVHVVEFDNTASLKGLRMIGVAAGDSTLYTVPAGKTAMFISNPKVIQYGPVPGGLYSSGNTAAIVNVDVYIIPNGQAKDITTKRVINYATPSGQSGRVCTLPTLVAGDKILITNLGGTTPADQMFHANVLEM